MKTPKRPLVYQELVDFIARSDPHRLLAFRLSSKAARRVEMLANREKENRLTTAERDELDTYMHLSRILMLAQSQAYKMLIGVYP